MKEKGEETRRLSQQDEEALRESEERYRRLVELSPETIAIHCEGKIVYINAAGASLLGAQSPEELLGRRVLDFVHPEDRERVQARIRQVLEEGREAELTEERFVRPDGQVLYVEVSGTPITYRGKPAAQVVVRDITRRRQAEEALRASEEQYRELVENINDVIFAVDAEGRFTYISPVIQKVGGLSPAEVLGRSFTEFIHPEDLPQLLESFGRTLSGTLEPAEFRIRTPSGQIRWVRTSSQPIVRGEVVVGVRGVMTDITERKLVEEALRASEERYRDLVENSEDLICMHDLDGVILSVNRALVRRLGYERPEEILGRKISDFLVPEMRPLFAAYLERIAREGQAHGLMRVLTRQGEERVLEYHNSLRTEGVQRPLVRGLAHDVTERKRAQDKLKEEAQVSGALAHVGQEIMAALDAPNLPERLCRLAAEVLQAHWSYILLFQAEEKAYTAVAGWGLGPEQEEVVKILKIPSHTLAPLATRLEEEGVVEVEEGKPPFFPKIIPRHPDTQSILGFALWRGKELLGIQLCGYRKSQDLPPSAFRIARGISQVASLALAHARLLEELFQANRLKEEFVSTMSHELRTPLNIILGYTQLLLEGVFGPLVPAQRDTLERLEKNATELLDLINAILDLSRLQSKRAPLNLSSVAPAELFSELQAETLPLNRNPAVRLEFRTAADLPPLRTDVVKLKMVLKNLISNALKFTPAGQVLVEAQRQGEGIAFGVRDTGVGIAPEDLPLIFEPFRQAGNPTVHPPAGVGLGLYIVRQLLEVLGGKISAESTPGQGSTFWVWVPLNATKADILPGREQKPRLLGLGNPKGWNHGKET